MEHLMDTTLALAREAFDRQAWTEAYSLLSTSEREGALDASDAERLGKVCYLIGRIAEGIERWEQAYNRFLNGGEIAHAARCVFWIAIALFEGGQHSRAGGWLARGQRLLDDEALECAERGYLMIPGALQALGKRDPRTALSIFEEVAEIAERFADPDLVTYGFLGRGTALVHMGNAAEGVVLLDEAMISATSGEVSPLITGTVYCQVIIACKMVFDLHRAEEWTEALSRWCASQPDLQPFRGQCLVHRSEIMQLRGDWSLALDEVEQACLHLANRPNDPVMGMAQYQQAELLRLRGEFDRAEEAYRRADEWGHPIQPGLALLRLAQGRTDDAVGAIRRVVAEAQGPVQRSRILAAMVEIMLVVGDVEATRSAADELAEIATAFDSSYLQAMASQARGAAYMADGDMRLACDALREALTAWQALEAPYQASRVRMSLARAYRELGDHDTARVELDSARRVFEDLSALPDREEVRALTGEVPSSAGGLTPRELDVLRLVATGATNRDVAEELVISEKTVARHLSNIFTKLGISSRSAATAYAYEHGLL
jgi:DNA-binding NarL/FixJ family response regulator